MIWLVVATAGSVGLGLLVAALFDRIKRESLAKIFIFTPLAISLVGATVIWKFVYAYQPPSQPQFGLLNAIWTAFGNKPVAWATTFPINLPAEMLIMIWLQTGFAMVVLSAAIKGVSVEVLEAARLDGASERQIFFGIIVPLIRGSIVTVATTIAIATLKIFDIVYSISGGLNHDNVVAVRMFQEMFQFFNDGRAAALATVLFIAVLPVMVLNLRNFRRQAGDVMTAPRRADRPRPRSKARRFWRAPLLNSLPLRLSVIVICFLWTLPTAGLLVTSFRNPQLITKTGWWEGLFNLFGADQWTLRELRAGPGRRGHGRRLPEQPHRDHPVDGDPDHHRGLRRVCVRVDPVPRPRHPVHHRRGAARRAAPDGADPDPQDLQRRVAVRHRSSGIWLAHTAFGLPLAIFLLYNFMSQLPRDLFESAVDRRRVRLPDVHPDRAAAVGPGARRVRDLPVPVGLERPPRGAGVPRPRQGRAGHADGSCSTCSARAAARGTC